MTDKPACIRLGEVAERFGLRLQGDPDHIIEGVATLHNAQPNQISFLSNPKYRSELDHTRAGAVVLSEQYLEDCPTNALAAEDPYLAYARIASVFEPAHAPDSGVHPSAVVSPEAEVGDGVSIGPNAVIAAACKIGDRSTVGAGTVIGPNCSVGRACTLHPNVTLVRNVSLGDRVILHPGCVLGADGFGIAFDKSGGRWEKVPQLGGVRLGNDCEVGANSAIDRGAIEDTVLEDDVRVDNLVQIGHNVHIGAHTAIAGSVGIAGSTSIGRYCMLAGKVGISGHLTIADKTTIAGGSNVMRNIDEPGLTWDGNIIAQPIRNWQRILARLMKLEALYKRVRALEKHKGESQEHE
jgi:UDP-3-O-[3-hydroxymyristoyl] glucosamine N-acyltransferase